MRTEHLNRIHQAVIGVDQATLELEAAVAAARDEGHSWAEIGRILGISRQAAFKRFGKVIDPTTGELMTARTTDHLQALAEKFWTHVANNEEAQGMEMLSPTARKLLPWKDIMKVWTQVLEELGQLEGFNNGNVQPYKGGGYTDATSVTDAAKSLINTATSKVLGMAIYVNDLNFEAGELMGRLAFNRKDEIDGVLILPKDAQKFEF